MIKVASIQKLSIDDYIKTARIADYVEVPSYVDAKEKESILKNMANQKYHFDIYISYDNTVNNNPVYYLFLIFDDQLTETEYQLVK